jgi:hypothetical protein
MDEGIRPFQLGIAEADIVDLLVLLAPQTIYGLFAARNRYAAPEQQATAWRVRPMR